VSGPGGGGSGPGARHPLPPLADPVWQVPEPPDPEAADALAAALSLPRSLTALLVARGIRDPETARRYLRPQLEVLRDPAALPDMDRAVERIHEALERGETLFIHGDYDVDGVAATALLTRWLRALGGRVIPFVPHRIRDGYDLGVSAVERAHASGATLIVTCDSGIRAVESVARATELAIDVVITDHHTPGHTLPGALAVVNPVRPEGDPRDRGLSGTGVAWKLCQALARRRGVEESGLYPLLSLVALATIADLVPLTEDNRIFVRFGLRYLAHTPDPGLLALLERAGVERDGGNVSESDVGFRLAPRINAIGRMGDAGRALELLLAEDPQVAATLADELEEANRVRRDEEARTLEQAMALLSADFDPETDFGVVLAHEGWHPGVVGIVASRVVEAVHRPVLLVALDGAGVGKGSGRSIRSVHLLDAITRGCAPLLRRFGGHRQAAGIEVEASRIPELRVAFNTEVRAQLAGRQPRPELRPDLHLPLSAFDEEFERLLRYLAPFGMGNRRPLFGAFGLSIGGAPREVGGGSLKIHLEGEGRRLDAIGFGLARRRPPDSLGRGPVDALFHLERNEYQGRSTLQARLLDLRTERAPVDGERG
jgi:single-stranded-DNA-specific exonuclease